MSVTGITTELDEPFHQSAALDTAHIGDINGAFGTIRMATTARALAGVRAA